MGLFSRFWSTSRAAATRDLSPPDIMLHDCDFRINRGMLRIRAGREIDRRESVAHMLSEFCRELSALILVFVPLDYLLKGNKVGPNFWYQALEVPVVSFLLLGIGIFIERKDQG